MLIWVDENNNVVRIHNQPETLTDEEKMGGEQFDSIPTAQIIAGKVPVLKRINGVLSYEYITRPLTPEEELQQLQAEKAALEQKLAQLNGDFVAFTDFYFEKNPTQA